MAHVEKDAVTYDQGGDVERRRSSVADINLNRNLDAKYAYLLAKHLS